MDKNKVYEKIIDDLVNNNYAQVDGFFAKSTCIGLKELLLEKEKEGIFKKATIGNKVNAKKVLTIRSDKISWIENNSENEFEKAFNFQIHDFCTYLNRTCYTGIKDWEFHYALFEKGAFYKRHIDRFKNDNSRKYSVVTYLNQNRQIDDGGALVIYTDQGAVTILPEWGRTVIFKSDLLEHEVMVSRKDRLSITGWLK
ncbi:MAG: 2OG-Fe(II) oxygenase [Saprospiraceae bacterium]